MNMPGKIVTVILLALLAAACGNRERDRLIRVNRLADADAEMAAAALDSIDLSTLSEADRNLGALTSIKINDKLYVKHTSTDEIDRLTEYYEAHRSDPFYPEALYYAGRVYSDLGDKYLALEYFHMAEKALAGDSSNYVLWGNILSQTGRVLDDMRDYSDAQRYMRRVIAAEREHDDLTNLMYDLDNLGFSYLHSGDYSEAMSCFREAYALAAEVDSTYCLRERMLMAEVHNYQDRLDSALLLIRGVPEAIVDADRTLALALAADIYRRNGINDTAFLYSRQLADSTGDANLKTALKTMLKPGVVEYVHPDSIYNLVSEYSEVVQGAMNQRGDTLAKINMVRYGYDTRETRLEHSERKRRIGLLWLCLTCVTLVLATATVVLMRRRNVRQSYRLERASADSEKLQQEISRLIQRIGELDKIVPGADSSAYADERAVETGVRREKLLVDLLDISKRCPETQIPETLLTSPVYRELTEITKKPDVIAEKDPFWQRLIEAVNIACPDFMPRLTILSGGRMDMIDQRIVLLTRCRVRLSAIAKLVGRSKSTVSERRQKLAESILSGLPDTQLANIGVGNVNGKWLERIIYLL